MRSGIWLSYNNQEEGFKLPVNPETIEVKSGGNGKTYNVLGLGEVNVIQDRKLSGIEFESLFPAADYPFIEQDAILLQPSHYIEYIEKWWATNRPIRFVYVGDTVDINLAVSIENFDYKEKAGSPRDIEYKLSLKKYVFYSANRVTVTSPSEVEVKPKRVDERITPPTYNMKPGDNLFRVCKKYGCELKQVLKLNKLTDEQAKKLKVGTIIRLR
ncbi:LysM domain-containing protein [Paenibacillus larvae]